MALQKARFDFGVRSSLCGEHDLHAKEHEHRKDDGDDALRFPPEKRGNSRLGRVITPNFPHRRAGSICFGGAGFRGFPFQSSLFALYLIHLTAL